MNDQEEWGASGYLGPVISRFISRVLWTDVAVAVFFIFLVFNIAPTLPEIPAEARVGRASTWMDRFIGAACLQAVLAGIAVFYYIFKKKPGVLAPYLVGKCLLFLWLVAGVLGLSSVHGKLFLPALVLLWNCAVIGIVFVYRLDQRMRGRR